MERLAGRHLLGAEELIELGRSDRRPFLADRPHLLGQLEALGRVGGFVSNLFGEGFELLADFVKIPTGILSEGVDVVFTSVAGLLDQIPVLGVLASQLVLLAGAVIKFALSVPGLLLEGVSNVFKGLSKALDAKYSEAEQQEKKKEGAGAMLERALKTGGEPLKDAVADFLGVSRDTPPPPPEAEAPLSDEPGFDWVGTGLPLAAGALVLALVFA